MEPRNYGKTNSTHVSGVGNCVSKTHIRQTGGVQLKYAAPSLPFLNEGNISVADCMPIISLLISQN